MKEKWEKSDLVILDELGYVAFERLEEIFKDTMLTGTIVDRLAHTRGKMKDQFARL